MTDTESMKTGELIDEVKARLAQKNSAFEGLLGRLEELRSERYDLICKRDRWQTRAESAEARVEELTTENARLEEELSRERALGDAANGERNVAGEAAMRAREERDGWQRLCVKVTEERDDLRAENARLEQELVSAEMGKSPAEQEIKILRVEKERLEQELSTTGEDSEHRFLEMERLAEECDGLRIENARLDNELAKKRAEAREAATLYLSERDDLRAENERLREESEGYAQYGLQMKRRLKHARTAVPRVIEPIEVRFGQKIVFSKHNNENEWVVEVADWETRFASDYNGTILLLRDADAPEDADEGDGHVYINVAPRIGPKTKTAIRDIQEHLKRNGHYAEEDRPAGGCDCGCGVTG